MSTASSARNNNDHVNEKSLNQKVALAFGALYIVVGIVGFLTSGIEPFAGKEGDLLVLFKVNGLHNVVHLLIGIALVVASKKHAAARSANMAIGAVYVLLGVVGFFIVNTALNIFALNTADHFLHLFSGAALLAVAMKDERATVRTA